MMKRLAGKGTAKVRTDESMSYRRARGAGAGVRPCDGQGLSFLGVKKGSHRHGADGLSALVLWHANVDESLTDLLIDLLTYVPPCTLSFVVDA
jgi:hypothetical protein